MDDRLKPETKPEDSQLSGRDLKDHMQGAISKAPGAPWLLVAALAATTVWFGWEAFVPEDYGDPLGTATFALEEQNELTVFSAQLSPVVSATDSRYMDMVQSRQVAVIPATVSYTLDLSEMDADRLNWNPATETLRVRLPDIEVGRPNLDEGRAQYLREGIWISREAQASLNRQNTMLAEEQAVEEASNPVLLGLARTAARDAVSHNLSTTLEVAGFENVTVDVRFDGEEAAES